MNDFDDWRRERQVRTAQGEGRHYDVNRPRARSSARGLRRTVREFARLDVLCGPTGRTLIARVYEQHERRELRVMLEAVGSSSGQAAAVTAPLGQPPAETPEAAGTWGWVLTDLVLGSVPIRVACRCRIKVHDLDPLKLRELACAAVSGRPRGVGVSLVTADYHS